MAPRHLIGMAAQGERAGRIADPFDVEPRNLLFETAGTEKQVFRRNTAILEIKRAPFLAPHERSGLANDKAGRAALDDDRSDPPVPGPNRT